MVESGLWTIQFSETEEFYDNLQVGEVINRGGTLVLSDGKVFGGGISYYFTGSYEPGNATITMSLTASRYNDLAPGIFGDDTAGQFSLTGTINDDKMKLHGFLESDKNKMLFIEAKKRSDI
jgi:hypothetical protein